MTNTGYVGRGVDIAYIGMDMCVSICPIIRHVHGNIYTRDDSKLYF
jgi:hypothetical protein